MTAQTVSQANRRLMRRLLIVVLAMFGFGFALVPLYNVFCDITGLNGKTRNQAVAAVNDEADKTRMVTIEFVASINQSAPWRFAPQVAKMQVHPGELYQTNFVAKNLSGEALVGQAIPSVAPGEAAQHFQKIECFCFARQDFKPHESKDMPVVFRLDPNLSPNISTVTLSYTFFKVDS